MPSESVGMSPDPPKLAIGSVLDVAKFFYRLTAWTFVEFFMDFDADKFPLVFCDMKFRIVRQG